MEFDDWVCQAKGEDDYVIERFEVRVKGKKPLVMNMPTYPKLVFVTQQYLNVSKAQAKVFIRQSVLDTPEPLCFDEYWQMVRGLEKHLAN